MDAYYLETASILEKTFKWESSLRTLVYNSRLKVLKVFLNRIYFVYGDNHREIFKIFIYLIVKISDFNNIAIILYKIWIHRALTVKLRRRPAGDFL
jgi:hypothetical protein